MKAQWAMIVQSTPMRLTLRLVALFLVISLLAFALTWWLANRALLDAAGAALDLELAELAASGDPSGIADAVRSHAARADPAQMILRYVGPGGVVGNYRDPLPGPGLRFFDPPRFADRYEERYVIQSRKVPGGVLSVGQSADAFEELAEVFGRVLAFTLLPTVGLVLAVGVLSARRAARRLGMIETTLERLCNGELSARLPEMPGPTDDLMRVGAGIDRLAEAQQAATEALRQISADIAHDLKTPIQRLCVQLAQMRAQLPSDAVPDALYRAEAELEGIVSTFQALLRIAQIEGGGPRARFAPVALAPLIKTMGDLYGPAAEESGHILNIEIERDGQVMGDRALLSQLVANLIENALRHTPSGSTVSLRLDAHRLVVADTGPGIPTDERTKVLRRLYRLDRSRMTPGSGLGLSLVEAVVKLHAGKLELQDNAPGLRVVIDLPMA